jgi:ribosomal protein L3 glutamine methyltransferase
MNSLDRQQALDHLTTAGDWVRWAASRFNQAELFFGHGTENAWDEAVNLVLTALHLLPDTPKKVFHAKLLPEEKIKIFNLIQDRVSTRKPLAYLLKQAWFCHRPFYVDERVLIPRSPMAEWLEKQFAPWVDPEAVQHILDIGTGSGCIAIAAAWFFPQAQVDAVDISKQALEVAAINVDKYQLQNRVQLLQSDCFDNLPKKKYDIIISNPPYVPMAEYSSLPAEYSHEPKNALLAGNDGLDVVRKILKDAGKYLSPGGVLVIEVGNSDEAFVEKFQDLPCTWLELERGGQGVLLITAEDLFTMGHY